MPWALEHILQRSLLRYATSAISLSGIETANEWLKAGDEPTFDAAETRRNIALEGITATELQ